MKLIFLFILIATCSLTVHAQDDVVLHSAKFVGDTQFIVVDGDGLHAHPFLVANIVFVGDALPQNGNELTIGSVTFTFRDSASAQHDIQIGGDVDSTVDNTRDVINDAHVVLRTSRLDRTITLVVAETVAPALTTTASGHAITVTSFNSCGAP